MKKFCKKLFALGLLASVAVANLTVIPAQTSDRAWSEEYFANWWWYYDGHVQFVPSYKTTSSSGYDLKAGKHVKKAYVNYTRDDKTVCGGRQYTSAATSKTDNSTYSKTVTVKDSLHLIGHTTHLRFL